MLLHQEGANHEKKLSLNVLLFTLSMVSVGCVSQSELDSAVSTARVEGYNQGYTDGHIDGYNQGFQEGYQKGVIDTAGLEGLSIAQAYNKGLDEGYTAGQLAGYDLGYDDGRYDGYNEGFVAGKQAGIDIGYQSGLNNGYNIGYADGEAVGYDNGYTDGNTDGFDTGYNLGYDDGWFDAGGSSQDMSKASASTEIAKSFVNSVVDFNSLKSPKQVLAEFSNDQTISEAAIDISKDPVAKNAILEKYLVENVKEQLENNFGLNENRAQKIARLANKVIITNNTRQISSHETNELALEVIGSDLATIQNAYVESTKGESTTLKNIIAKAASINEISEAKATTIMSKLFL